ncbi:hypothetical protein QYZ88_016050 [Lachnospiraceae bacterium C1.1]|nr:hypothetical protein [Lachnospiraceae bacterium C1.1]
MEQEQTTEQTSENGENTSAVDKNKLAEPSETVVSANITKENKNGEKTKASKSDTSKKSTAENEKKTIGNEDDQDTSEDNTPEKKNSSHFPIVIVSIVLVIGVFAYFKRDELIKLIAANGNEEDKSK